MDVIREHCMYPTVPLHVCVGQLTRQEQYECVRLFCATRPTQLTVCLDHGAVNLYVRTVLRDLGIRTCLCRTV